MLNVVFGHHQDIVWKRLRKHHVNPGGADPKGGSGVQNPIFVGPSNFIKRGKRCGHACECVTFSISVCLDLLLFLSIFPLGYRGGPKFPLQPKFKEYILVSNQPLFVKKKK